MQLTTINSCNMISFEEGELESSMYVCLCRGITDKQVRDAAQSGHQSVEDMREALGIASQCGQCSGLVEELIANSVAGPSSPTESPPGRSLGVQIWEEALA